MTGVRIFLITEEFLCECLDSILAITSDVVVIDTGSVDRTADLARDRGCRVFSYEWRDDFSAARNYGLQKAEGDWILSIDADERIHLNAAQADLDSLLERTDCQAFTAPIISYVGPGLVQARAEQDERIVLFKNNAKVRFQHRVHEDLSESLMACHGPNLKTGRLPLTIHHLGYLDPVVNARQKHARNIRLLELEIEESEPSPWVDYCLGTEWSSCGQWQKAVQPLERVVGHAALAPYWELAAHTLSYCYLQLGMPDRCIAVCDLARELEGDHQVPFAFMRKLAQWQASSSLSSMLSTLFATEFPLEEDYYAFLLAYRRAVEQLWSDTARARGTVIKSACLNLDYHSSPGGVNS